MNNELFTGKIGIVTGASQGIGAQVAKDLVTSGATVMLVARTEAKLRNVCNEAKDAHGRADFHVADVSDSVQLATLRDRMKNLYGRIDFIVNCAGITIKKRIIDMDEAEWDKVVNINLKSVFLMAHIFGPQLFRSEGQEHTKFIAFGSVGSSLGIPLSGAYCSAKGGIIQLAKVLAIEWARHQVNVNAICPGYILTPLSEGVLKIGSTREKILSRIPQRAFGNVADISAAVCFLLSQDSDYITGTSLQIDGGLMSAAYTLEE